MLVAFHGNGYSHFTCSVSSAIVQRYLNHVLDAALSQNIQIQAIAIDVLSFTIKQGLAHPLQVRQDVDLHYTTLIFIDLVFSRHHRSRDEPRYRNWQQGKRIACNSPGKACLSS